MVYIRFPLQKTEKNKRAEIPRVFQSVLHELRLTGIYARHFFQSYFQDHKYEVPKCFSQHSKRQKKNAFFFTHLEGYLQRTSYF